MVNKFNTSLGCTLYLKIISESKFFLHTNKQQSAYLTL
jgi:hypothetical protein